MAAEAAQARRPRFDANRRLADFLADFEFRQEFLGRLIGAGLGGSAALDDHLVPSVGSAVILPLTLISSNRPDAATL